MTKKRTKAARKKAARKKAAAVTASSSSVVGKKLADIVAAAGKLAERFRRRFAKPLREAIKSEQWDEIIKLLDSFSDRFANMQAAFQAALEQAKQSGDARLQRAAKLVEASGFGHLLGGMEEALTKQSVAAKAPLSEQEKKDLLAYVISLVEQARIVATSATELGNELMERHSGHLDQGQEALLLNIREALGKLAIAGTNFAFGCKPGEPQAPHQRFQDLRQAIHEYEGVLDNIRVQLSKYAEEASKAGSKWLAQRLGEFTEAVESRLAFDETVIDLLIESIGAAIRLPPRAAEAAADLSRIKLAVYPKLIAELSSSSGGGAGTGDSASPEMIRNYAVLKPQEQIVVDVFSRLAAEAGPLATLTVPEVIAKVRPELRSLGLAESDGTIKGILKKLSSPEESILLAEPTARIGGHGGALQYRLTFPAGRKYSRCVAAPGRPGPLAPTAKAEQPA